MENKFYFTVKLRIVYACLYVYSLKSQPTPFNIIYNTYVYVCIYKVNKIFKKLFTHSLNTNDKYIV